jgi:hypothetical protein
MRGAERAVRGRSVRQRRARDDSGSWRRAESSEIIVLGNPCLDISTSGAATNVECTNSRRLIESDQIQIWQLARSVHFQSEVAGAEKGGAVTSRVALLPFSLDQNRHAGSFRRLLSSFTLISTLPCQS